MVNYLRRKYIYTDDITKKVLVWAVIAVDDESQLAESYDNTLLSFGSIALCISTGKIYALNSLKEWVQQDNITISV